MLSGLRLLTVIFLAAGMFFYPREVLSAAAGGLSLWWQYVLPALLPFFILSELLMAQGIVHFLGVVLEPLMRPLFRLPGKAAFVVAMGYTSGFPMGAVLTSRLREEGALTRAEGEHLLAFTNNPSPGFMFGAVASGMLGRPDVGVVLAGSVYLANLLVGLLFRYYRPSGVNEKIAPGSVRRAWQEMNLAKINDGRPFGRVLGDAIRQSINTVLAVGGFMAFFAVIIRLLTIWHITTHIATLFNPLLHFVLPKAAVESLLNGLLEMTLGCQGVINAFGGLTAQLGALAYLMGWSGISVFAQVASFTAKTDLRLRVFFVARIFHSLIALIICQLFLRQFKLPVAKPVMIPHSTTEIILNTWRQSAEIFFIAGLVLITLLLLLRFTWIGGR